MRTALFLLTCLLIGAVSPLQADRREIGVMVVLDEEMQRNVKGFRWEHYFKDILARASKQFKSEADVTFELVDVVNSNGAQYNYVVSERLGRTTSQEQYAYIYNTQTVKQVGEPHTYPEPSGTDPFHRQPYIA